MKITVVGDLLEDPSGGYTFPITVGKGTTARTVRLTFGGPTDKNGPYNPDDPEPRRVFYDSDNSPNGPWVFRRKAVYVEEAGGVALQELILRVKHIVLREEKVLARIQREVEAFENIERVASAGRERIPESVRLFVWQRDEGKCVRCGSRERLEFDHIIPVALGGSNTERNIQLLCERCN
jgi:HNH endonuclease